MAAASEIIRNHLLTIRQRIAAACERSGRDADSVTIVAVVKYAHLEWVSALLDQGVTELGESRPQQLIDRSGLIDGAIRWHLIGHLQRNKIRKILPLVTMIHSVDSLNLLRAIDRIAGDLELTIPVLLQMNLSGEESKGGFDAAGWSNVWKAVHTYRNVNVRGLMTMAPGSRDLDAARKTFAELRKLRDEIVRQHDGELTLPELSMGMSGDFEIAVEEGATLVRIGSRLFEGLELAAP